MTKRYEFKVLGESTLDDTTKGWKHKCGAILMGKTVFLTVRDGVSSLSGSGEVQREVVPYCPTCEPNIRTYGSISPDGTIDHPSYILEQESQPASN